MKTKRKLKYDHVESSCCSRNEVIRFLAKKLQVRSKEERGVLVRGEVLWPFENHCRIASLSYLGVINKILSYILKKVMGRDTFGHCW